MHPPPPPVVARVIFHEQGLSLENSTLLLHDFLTIRVRMGITRMWVGVVFCLWVLNSN
jgi:hypothetical protein